MMALSDFAIDQVGLSAGVPTVSRRDILPTSIAGGPVTFTADNVGITYKWEFTQTPGSSVVPVGAGSQICTLPAELEGGYLVRLTANEGFPTEDISELYFGIGVLVNGVRYPLPALNETVQDNSIGTPEFGWLEKELAILRALVAGVFTGSSWLGTTADATPTELYLGGVAPTREIVPLNDLTYYSIMVKAFSSLHGGAGKIWRVEFAVKNLGSGMTSLLDIPVITILGQTSVPGGGSGTDLWDIAATVDAMTDSLILTATGEAALNVTWVAQS
jgi:hypothetical protein